MPNNSKLQMDAEVVIYCGEENNLDYDVELEEGEVLEEVKVREVPGISKILRAEDAVGVEVERGFEEVQGGYKCFCGAKCTRMGALQRHWKHSHSQNIEKYRCLDCHMTTVIDFDVIRHGREKHGWDEERVKIFRSMEPFVGNNKYYLSPRGRVGPEVKKVGRPKVAEKRKIEDKENEVVPMNREPKKEENALATEEEGRMEKDSPKKKISRMNRIFQQPAPPPKELKDIRLKLKDAIYARELAIRNVDELHQQEKRFYLERQGEKENAEDLKIEYEVLREENKRLKKFIKIMMSK